jgi:hypothetical protein
MSQEWLACYQIGLDSGTRTVQGNMTVTVNALTNTALRAIREHIRADFIKENPECTNVQNVVFVSLVRLESE